MSKQDRNTQREQDRQNLESADLQSNKPEQSRGTPQRDSAKSVARERDTAKGQPGPAGRNAEDLKRQDDGLK
ncbi:MAG: hypothetical protein JWN73_251 [Betaproteobacteria bacterium]|nr:hypothetical protein [Betaproteobacteria bacterium]